jgi:hypothetical protein
MLLQRQLITANGDPESVSTYPDALSLLALYGEE